MQVISRFSPSDINSFRYCPRMWFYNHSGLNGVEFENEKAEQGKSIHNTIKNYFKKIPKNPSEYEIEKIARDTFDESFELRGQKVKRVVDNFIEFEKSRLFKWKQYYPTFIEQRFEGRIFPDLPDFNFVTIVDFYDEADQIIIDWKTGGEESEENMMTQGKIYELMLKYHQNLVQKVYFVNLNLNTVYTLPRVTEGWILQICNHIISSHNNGRYPKNSGGCRYCRWVLNCDFDKECLWW